MWDLLPNHGAEYDSHFVLSTQSVFFAPRDFVNGLSSLKNLLVVFESNHRLLESLIDLGDLPESFHAFLNPSSSCIVRLVVERVSCLLGLLALVKAWPVVPNQQVVVVQGLKALEKVVA